MKKLSKLFMAAVFAMLPTMSSAGTVSFVVDAKIHSSNTLNGYATGVILEEGEEFTVTADRTDTWFLGGLTTDYTNANGLTDFPLYSQANMTALYGTLVGRIGSGGFFSIGTNFEGPAKNAGELFLFNWDSGNSENLDQIMATVTTADRVEAPNPVPVPASGGLLAIALMGFGLMMRRN